MNYDTCNWDYFNLITIKDQETIPFTKEKKPFLQF